MAKIDPRLVELLKAYGEDNTSVWDCHGTWVAYHAAIERMAARAGIFFDSPQMIVNDHEKKTVVIIVFARMGEKSEWSFGEVSPSNNKNAYPYAMAEKRAKDRVALKLLGMAGLAYSEEEADDFKSSRPATESTVKKASETGPNDVTKPISAAEQKRQLAEIDQDLLDCATVADVNKCAKVWATIMERDQWSPAFREAAKPKFQARRDELSDVVDDIQDTFPGSRVTNETIRNHPMNAG